MELGWKYYYYCKSADNLASCARPRRASAPRTCPMGCEEIHFHLFAAGPAGAGANGYFSAALAHGWALAVCIETTGLRMALLRIIILEFSRHMTLIQRHTSVRRLLLNITCSIPRTHCATWSEQIATRSPPREVRQSGEQLSFQRSQHNTKAWASY